MIIAFQVLLLIITFISLGVILDKDMDTWAGVVLCIASIVTIFSTLMWLQ